MNNVTVTLEDKAADYERAMRRYLERPPAKLSQPGDPYPTREQLHDRHDRHELR